jgi:hypothetical protein
MRISVPAALAIQILGASAASAGKSTGESGGGGGALGHVSAGLGRATGGNGGAPSGGSRDDTPRYAEDQLPTERCPDGQRPRQRVPREERCDRVAMLTGTAGLTVVEAPDAHAPPPTATLDVYGALQSVHDSDGAWTIEVGVHDRRFRLAGSLTQFHESQANGPALTMTMPALIGSVRIDDGAATRVYLQLGAVGAKTQHDPMTDSSVAGALGGVRVEHPVARHTQLIGEAQAMAFESSVRAYELRAGVRVGPLEASFRTLDFNVGPALYGPEVGLRF